MSVSFFVGRMWGDIMTEKQKLFADEYLIDLNATRAYRAVYKNIKSDDVARKNGSRLLTNADIKKYIDGRLEEIKSQKVAKAQEVMEYLTAVMRGKTQSEVLRFIRDGYQEKYLKAPEEKERLRAAELLGKRYSLFSENIKLAENAAVQIIDDISGDENG